MKLKHGDLVDLYIGKRNPIRVYVDNISFMKEPYHQSQNKKITETTMCINIRFPNNELKNIRNFGYSKKYKIKAVDLNGREVFNEKGWFYSAVIIEWTSTMNIQTIQIIFEKLEKDMQKNDIIIH